MKKQKQIKFSRTYHDAHNNPCINLSEFPEDFHSDVFVFADQELEPEFYTVDKELMTHVNVGNHIVSVSREDFHAEVFEVVKITKAFIWVAFIGAHSAP